MSTLAFNGSSRYIDSSSFSAGLAGALTTAALLRRGALSVSHSFFCPAGASNCFSLFIQNNARLNIYNDNTSTTTGASDASANLIDNTTDLFIAGHTRGSGETPRFHVYDITNDVFGHDNAESAQTANPDAGTHVVVGAHYFGGSYYDYFHGDIGLIAWWDGIEMSDAEWEELAANLQTSDWHNHSVGEPTSLSELTSLTPTDLEGFVTWTITGATLTGNAMSAWDFDGTGPTPEAPANTVAPAITGLLSVGSTLTCSTGTWTGYPTPTYAYQWKNGGTNISGETASTYVIDAGDVGDNIKCTVTATNASGSDSEDSNTVVPTSATDDILVKVGGVWVPTNFKVKVSGEWV